MELQKITDKLAYCGEQALSFLDEIIKSPCPRCGKSNLGITFVGKDLIIRCSEQLQEYEEDRQVVGHVCKFAKIVERVSLTEGPFLLNFEEKRATAANRKIRKGPGRPRTKNS